MAENVKPCFELRCKEMYYKDVNAPPSPEELERRKLYGYADGRIFWCNCTQTGFGPDDKSVGLSECARKDRPCYKGLEQMT